MYLYGAGGHAKVIMDILKENSTELTGIIDDNPHIQEWMEYHVLSYDPKRMFPILISIGNNSIRKNIAEQLYKKNAVFGTVISIHAIVSPYTKIGEGSVVMPVFYIGVFLTFYWFKLNFAQGELVLFMLLCSINISYL